MAIYMDAGPSVMYPSHALEASTRFEHGAKPAAPMPAPASAKGLNADVHVRAVSRGLRVALGHSYMELPHFGVTPCAVALCTFGSGGSSCWRVYRGETIDGDVVLATSQPLACQREMTSLGEMS